MNYPLRLGLLIRLGFGGILCATIGVGLVSKLITDRLTNAQQWVEHTYEVLSDLKDLQALLVDAETGQRGFLLTGQEQFLDPYNQALLAIDETLDELGQSIADNLEQRQRLQDVSGAIDLKLEELQRTIRLQRLGQREQTMVIVLSGEGRQYMAKIRGQIKQMVEVEQGLLQEREQTLAQLVRLANVGNLVATMLAIAFGLLVLAWIQHHIIRTINLTATAISRSAAEISVTVEQQEHVASQQALAVHETSTSLDQMNTSVRQTAAQSNDAAHQATQALNLSEGGSQAVEHTLQQMHELQQSVGAIATQIRQLESQAVQIGNISGLVSNVANQTNMLALNAAVEAVRAGEGGQGFAVVAAEIRKLADQSKRSAEQISTLVGTIQQAINATVNATDTGTSKVAAGVQIATDTEQTFGGVKDAVTGVVLNNQQIALNIQQQSSGIAQIVTVIQELSQASQSTADGITQITQEIKQLKAAATTLQQLV